MIANPKNDATASCDTEDALCSDHRIPANTYTWRMRTSCPSFTDCLHEMSVPTSYGCTPGPSSCPTQLSVDLAVFQQCTGCLLCKLRESAKWYPWLATRSPGIFLEKMIANPKNDATASCDTEDALCSDHRIPANTYTWRMRTSCPSFTDCLHEMSVPTSCGCTPGPSSCPTQLSVDLAVFQQCTRCLLCKLREPAKWYPWLATIGIFPWENDMILNPKNDAPASCDTEEARCSLFRPSKTTNTFYSDTPSIRHLVRHERWP